jgi:hypothetical protein
MGWASALCPSIEGYRCDGSACSLQRGRRSTKTSGVPILISSVFREGRATMFQQEARNQGQMYLSAPNPF